MLNKENLSKLTREMFTAEQVRTGDIPDIDLYMDQVTTFMDKKLGGFKRCENDKILSKAMINNYTKAGLLKPPKNKKYSRENMILLILIYKLKQLLTINDIGELFSPLFKKMEKDEDFLENIYDTLLELEAERYHKLEENAFNEMEAVKAESIDTGDEEPQLQWLLMVMLLVGRAESERRLAEKIIDTYF